MAEPPEPAGDVPLTVLGVRVELPEQQHVILLLDPPGEIVLPLWVGSPEAAAAALALEGAPSPRPGTHALLLAALAAAGSRLRGVRLTRIEDETVHAALLLDGGAEVDARASDAVVLAVRAQVPVLCAAEVIAAAGMAARDAAAGDEDEVDDFRAFLDSVDPEDFA
ncbi:bifunctional nuclease family protein [Micrococcus porci]|uniref:bifunctional nuclease family protein n=1 Tax=Micrococcus porci TaxID=2856555 RepID=UPI001CCB4DF2|nr:bifunctional nuclease domain-containing protein [Micrococcus porci]UBH23668.1 bifunctional nuclease family protein [Micrococcus porci]